VTGCDALIPSAATATAFALLSALGSRPGSRRRGAAQWRGRARGCVPVGEEALDARGGEQDGEQTENNSDEPGETRPWVVGAWDASTARAVSTSSTAPSTGVGVRSMGARGVVEAVGVEAVDRERGVSEGVVGRGVGVHPHERGDGRGEQDRRPAGLGAEELPQRALEASRPGGASREGSWGLRGGPDQDRASRRLARGTQPPLRRGTDDDLADVHRRARCRSSGREDESEPYAPEADPVAVAQHASGCRCAVDVDADLAAVVEDAHAGLVSDEDRVAS
jgi:hypothetical protein